MPDSVHKVKWKKKLQRTTFRLGKRSRKYRFSFCRNETSVYWSPHWSDTIMAHTVFGWNRTFFLSWLPPTALHTLRASTRKKPLIVFIETTQLWQSKRDTRFFRPFRWRLSAPNWSLGRVKIMFLASDFPTVVFPCSRGAFISLVLARAPDRIVFGNFPTTVLWNDFRQIGLEGAKRRTCSWDVGADLRKGSRREDDTHRLWALRA